MEEAFRQMAEWRRGQIGKEFTIRVNLSPAQLSTSNILELVSECLVENELPGRLVCFEITEHALMHNTQQAIETLHSLRLLGITLAMDDFGTGFSSMVQLKTLPLDVLKIDQSFVAGLGADGGDRAIVDASVRLARSFGLDTVAEGIETPALLDQLVRLGCDRGQGYLMMRPSPAEDLRELIERGRMDLDALRQVRGTRHGGAAPTASREESGTTHGPHHSIEGQRCREDLSSVPVKSEWGPSQAGGGTRRSQR
jgi:EAL domain-containing protein (putative c-di-GMP-specific phosphodiesterase class I)